MEPEISNLLLLQTFRQCAHLQHHYGQTDGQGRILTLLREGATTQRALSERLQRRSATLSEQLGLMEKDGLIVRTINEADKRNVDVRLTPAGECAAEDAARERARVADALFEGFGPAERKELLRLLERLRETWRALPAETGAER